MEVSVKASTTPIKNPDELKGPHSGVVISTPASQQDHRSWVQTWVWPYCVELACSPCVCVCSSYSLKYVHVRSIEDSKLSLCMYVYVL